MIFITISSRIISSIQQVVFLSFVFLFLCFVVPRGILTLYHALKTWRNRAAELMEITSAMNVTNEMQSIGWALNLTWDFTEVLFVEG